LGRPGPSFYRQRARKRRKKWTADVSLRPEKSTEDNCAEGDLDFLLRTQGGGHSLEPTLWGDEKLGRSKTGGRQFGSYCHTSRKMWGGGGWGGWLVRRESLPGFPSRIERSNYPPVGEKKRRTGPMGGGLQGHLYGIGGRKLTSRPMIDCKHRSLDPVGGSRQLKREGGPLSEKKRGKEEIRLVGEQNRFHSREKKRRNQSPEVGAQDFSQGAEADIKKRKKSSPSLEENGEHREKKPYDSPRGISRDKECSLNKASKKGGVEKHSQKKPSLKGEVGKVPILIFSTSIPAVGRPLMERKEQAA